MSNTPQLRVGKALAAVGDPLSQEAFDLVQEIMRNHGEIVRENARLRHAMQNILTMIDGKVDADMDSETGRYVSNTYGSIQSEIDRALGSLSTENT